MPVATVLVGHQSEFRTGDSTSGGRLVNKSWSQAGAEVVPKYLTMVHLGGLMHRPILNWRQGVTDEFAADETSRRLDGSGSSPESSDRPDASETTAAMKPRNPATSTPTDPTAAASIELSSATIAVTPNATQNTPNVTRPSDIVRLPIAHLDLSHSDVDVDANRWTIQ